MNTPAAAESSPLSVTIVPVYQPIVALPSRAVVGYEALTRTPADAGWSTPAELFRAAEEMGVADEFDWRCRLAALAGALEAHFPPDLMLSINAEPTAIDAPAPPEARPLVAAARGLSITVEITERNLLRDPAGLLRAVGYSRHLGWRIALDDVGADSSSLAMLEMLRPDVIKLDMRFVHDRPTPEMTAVLVAVQRQAARTGAVVLAEGIETEEHEQRALELGATWGQGWLYGHPGELPAFRPAPTTTVAEPAPSDPAITVRNPAAVTPRGLTRDIPSTPCDLAALDVLETRLLAEAAVLGPATLVFMTVPASSELTPERRQLLGHVAARTAVTAVFHTVAEPQAPYRAVPVGVDDPLARERSVIVVAPTFTASLIALELDDGTYDHTLTHDRDITLDAATLLLRRIPAEIVNE